MRIIKNILPFLAIIILLFSCSQGNTVNDENKVRNKIHSGKKSLNSGDSVAAVGELIKFLGGDKIHFAKFKIIKVLFGTLNRNDTVSIGYYFYKEPDITLTHALLNVKKYERECAIDNYYICPNYDGELGIQKINKDSID